MANFFRRKKNQPSPYDSVWDPNTNTWQAPVASGQGLPAAAYNATAASAVQNATTDVNANPALSYGAFPAAPQAYMPPIQIPVTSYDAFPAVTTSAGFTDTTSATSVGLPTDSGTTYSAFPDAPTYGAFPDPQPYAGGGSTPITYGGFPPPTSYTAFPASATSQLDPAIQTAMNAQASTYSAFPSTDSGQLDPAIQTAMGAHTTATYSAFPSGDPLDPAIQAAMGGQTASYGGFPGTSSSNSLSTQPVGTAPELVSENGGLVSPTKSGTAPELVSEHGGLVNTAGDTSRTTYTAPLSSSLPGIADHAASGIDPALNTEVGPNAEAWKTSGGNQSAMPTVPSANSSSIANAEFPNAGNIASVVNPPITLPPTTQGDTPPTGVGALSPTNYAADPTQASVPRHFADYSQ